MNTIPYLRQKLEKPERIGKYIIVREIGVGATSVVYLAGTEQGKLVAIKRLFPWHNSSNFQRMMQTEAALSGKLKHRNIVSVIDSVMNDPEGSYLVLDYVDGCGLDVYTKPDTLLPVIVVINIIRQACEALNYAYQLGIVHRDIKPGNILYSEQDGTAKLTDFGCAIIENSGLTQIGMAGSLSYMSPEQVNNGVIDYRSDIYALGVMFYKLLCGLSPFQAQTADQLIDAIIAGNSVPLLEHRVLPDSLIKIVEKCMAADPYDRYQTHAAILGDLHRLIDDSIGSRTNKTMDVHNQMVHCNFFKGYPSKNLWEILHAGMVKPLNARDTLIADGEHGFSFFVVLEGKLVITKGTRLLNILSTGDCAGEDVVFGTSAVHASNVVAMDDSIVLEITASRVKKFSPETAVMIYESIVKSVIEKLKTSNTRLFSMIDEKSRLNQAFQR